VEVLRGLGGFTAVLSDTIDRIIDRHRSNPRVRDTLELLRSDLMQEMPAMRQQIQQHLQRVKLVERRPGNMGGAGPLGEGSYYEMRLRATALDFVGIVDLLQIAEGRCTLWEFKTGHPDTQHIEQLRAYALLWFEDKQRNPGRMPIQRLVLSYGTHCKELPPPDEKELNVLRDHLKDRIAHAMATVQSDSNPPVARPSPENCKFCGVRQLCSDYWSSFALWSGADRQEWTDVEVRVRTARGPRSWDADLLIAPGANCGSAVVIMASTSRTLDEGAHMRLLSVRKDLVDGVTQISITAFSEMFEMC
jgi:CRISPR/Cas system-associated exonuclease Cas4 (RecB family)